VPASELAGVLAGALRGRGLGGARAALEDFVAERPGHRDAERALEALAILDAEVARQVHLTQASTRTMPMVGDTAAVMQIRMGNLENGASVYRRLAATGEDQRAEILLAEVEILLAALAGEPLGDDELAGEATQMRASMLEGFPMTKETRLPEESGPVVVSRGVASPDEAPTEEQPSAEAHVERLVVEGRLAEAEEVLRSLASLEPARAELTRRADELRRQRLGRAAAADVLVHVILPVK